MIMHLLGNLVAFVLGEGGGEADSMGREMEAACGERSFEKSGLREIWERGLDGTVWDSLLQKEETFIYLINAQRTLAVHTGSHTKLLTNIHSLAWLIL